MYKYLGCGLDNILLRNGHELRKTASGVDVVAIQDVAGLHRAIAKNLCDVTRPLTSKEFRFLRKELDMSQRQVALLARVEEQTVSLWERGSPINSASEMLLRSLMKENLSGNPEVPSSSAVILQRRQRRSDGRPPCQRRSPRALSLSETCGFPVPS